MILSKKSWHFTLHRLVYGDGRGLPTNFCPYFWKSIFLGSIIAIILLPFAIPLIIGRAIFKLFKAKEIPPSPFDEGLWSAFSLAATFLNIGLLLVYSMFAMWFVPLSYDKEGVAKEKLVHIAGGAGWLILTGMIVYILVEKIKEKREKVKYKRKEELGWKPEEKTPNVFVEAAKSWYKRNCPIIKWKD